MAYGRAGMSGLSVQYPVVRVLSTERGHVYSLSQEVRDVRERPISQECVRHKSAEVGCHRLTKSEPFRTHVDFYYNFFILGYSETSKFVTSIVY